MQEQRFRLLRYFSLTSLVIILVVSLALGIFYRQVLFSHLITVEESKNVTLTQAFTNSLWPQFIAFVNTASGLSRDELRAHPQTEQLRQAILSLTQGLSVVRVKIYNLDGLTVFSTQASQIGEDKSQNPAFQAARSGKVTGYLVYRNQRNDFEGTIEKRNVLSSYIPIRRGGQDGPIEGVVELYSDVTPLVQRMARTQKTVILGVLLCLSSLYVVLFFIVRHADHLIQDQYRALQAARDELERRVEERTAALVQANKQLEQEVAERKAMEEELKTLVTRLECSNRELEDFAYVASHDLQEPLRKIQAFGDRLQTKYGPVLDAQGRDYLERMQRAAHRMQMFITDLLTFSRVTTKAQPFTPVDLNQTVQAVLSDLEVQIEQTGGRVETGELPVIEADPTQMHQLLQNLISNALKFRREGERPVVRIRAELSAQQCQLRIEDNGIGFDERYLDRIFMPFQRLHGRDQYGGTGIGLAVCRKIVERHGGSITANSAPGQGATFIVTLPVKQGRESL